MKNVGEQMKTQNDIIMDVISLRDFYKGELTSATDDGINTAILAHVSLHQTVILGEISKWLETIHRQGLMGEHVCTL